MCKPSPARAHLLTLDLARPAAASPPPHGNSTSVARRMILLLLTVVLQSATARGGPYQVAVLADNPVAYWGLDQSAASETAVNLGLLGQTADGFYDADSLLAQPSLVNNEMGGSLKVASGSRMMTDPFDKFSPVNGIGGDGFTVEFWTALERPGSTFANLVGDGEGGVDFNLMVYLRQSQFIRPHVQTEELGFAALDTDEAIELGEIVHVVSTWDQDSGDLRLYLNGLEADTIVPFGAIPNDGTPANADNPIFVGQDGREPSANAWLDEVAIYNYPLSAAQVLQHFQLGQGAPSPLPEPPMPFPDPGDLPALPSGLVTYVDFNESDRPDENGTLDFAYDRADGNDGRFEGNATRAPGLVGLGAAAFDNSPGTQVNLGSGKDNNFSASDGIAVEALIRPEWSAEMFDYDEIFRKEDGGNRILFSFQNDPNNPGANPPVDAGPVLSFGLNTNGYQELDMPLDVDLSELEGGNAQSGTVWLLLPPDVELGPTDVVLNDGATHHAVATYDADSGEKAIWIDGVKRWSIALDDNPLVVSGGPATAYIGSVNGGENFNGLIDEFAFWNRGLTDDEIVAHFANVVAGNNYFGLAGDPCDYDGDGSVTFADLDVLRDEVRSGQNNQPFDVNHDGVVDRLDIQAYVSDPEKLNSFVGDANQDREFNSSDLVTVFRAGKFESGDEATWMDGDWDGDGFFRTTDLLFAFQAGGYEQGPRAGIAAHVPEPSGLAALVTATLLACATARRRKRNCR